MTSEEWLRSSAKTTMPLLPPKKKEGHGSTLPSAGMVTVAGARNTRCVMLPFFSYLHASCSRPRWSTAHTASMPLLSPLMSRLPSGEKVSRVMGALCVLLSSRSTRSLEPHTATVPSSQPVASRFKRGCQCSWPHSPERCRVTSGSKCSPCTTEGSGDIQRAGATRNESDRWLSCHLCPRCISAPSVPSSFPVMRAPMCYPVPPPDTC